MSSVKFTAHLEDLILDLKAIKKEAPDAFRGVVKESLKVGNDLAKAHAVVTSRRHAKLYPGKFSSKFGTDASTSKFAGEYGPLATGQGKLAPILERGSRNNPPHHDLAQSADIVGPMMAHKAGMAAERLFLEHGWR